jgi:hypothetical protein
MPTVAKPLLLHQKTDWTHSNPLQNNLHKNVTSRTEKLWNKHWFVSNFLLATLLIATTSLYLIVTLLSWCRDVFEKVEFSNVVFHGVFVFRTENRDQFPVPVLDESRSQTHLIPKGFLQNVNVIWQSRWGEMGNCLRLQLVAQVLILSQKYISLLHGKEISVFLDL